MLVKCLNLNSYGCNLYYRHSWKKVYFAERVFFITQKELLQMKKFIRGMIALMITCSIAVPALAQKQQPVLNHIAVYVKDLSVSTRFYRDIIQLDTIPEPFHDGRHTWFSVGPKSHLHLIQGAASVTAHDKNNHICFSIASVEAFIKQLAKFRIEYENWTGEKNAVTKRVDGVQQIYFKDPDGYWIEVNDARE